MGLKTVLITGSNRGIGLELTKSYLKSGDWEILACCRTPDQATVLLDLARQSDGKVSVMPLDVTDAASIRALVAALADRPIDLLINNAGIMGGANQSTLDMDFGQWQQAFEINTVAPLRMVQAVHTNLKQVTHAKIVTISCQMGSMSRIQPGNLAYRSTKAALNKVMQGVAFDLEKDGITVAMIHPGWVQTDMGGTAADITAEQSAGGIFKTISSLSLKDSGRFLIWTGEDHPW